ncbi:Response regulator receiver domain-containing protein [Rhizobiales bacterium GAS113]|nr:Response regulator receiver domain-containing protein [Rhizobiales bacterium GAS113]
MTAPLILVAEGDSAVLASLSFMLEAEGFRTCPFDNVIHLLEAEWLPKVSCLVVDYRMPTINGIDLLGHLRKRQILVPAILVTGHSDVMVRERALTAGFVGVVNKSLLDDSLVNEIRRVLAIA